MAEGRHVGWWAMWATGRGVRASGLRQGWEQGCREASSQDTGRSSEAQEDRRDQQIHSGGALWSPWAFRDVMVAGAG